MPTKNLGGISFGGQFPQPKVHRKENEQLPPSLLHLMAITKLWENSPIKRQNH